jgi:hypothetical protein
MSAAFFLQLAALQKASKKTLHFWALKTPEIFSSARFGSAQNRPRRD